MSSISENGERARQNSSGEFEPHENEANEGYKEKFFHGAVSLCDFLHKFLVMLECALVLIDSHGLGLEPRLFLVVIQLRLRLLLHNSFLRQKNLLLLGHDLSVLGDTFL